MRRALAIGVDLGATKIETALASSDGDLVHANRILTRSDEGASRILDRMADEINALIAVAHGDVVGVGIGAPGWLDAESGVIIDSVNLNWSGVRLVEELGLRLQVDLPIWIQIDTLASALGESYFGAGQSCSSFVYLSIGTGLGGGVVLNGQLLIGAHGLAGAIGHFSLDPTGLQCVCGLTGCPETIVSGDGLVRIVKQYLAEGRYVSALTAESVSARAIVNAAKQGDELAQAALAEVGHTLGTVIALSLTVIDPCRFVIGGGLGLAAFDFLVPAARAELQRRVLPIRYQDTQILPSGLASSAVGASCLVWAAQPTSKSPT